MSKTATSIEIQDVLSSVRKRPRPGTVASAGAAPLILGPEYRVDVPRPDASRDRQTGHLQTGSRHKVTERVIIERETSLSRDTFDFRPASSAPARNPRSAHRTPVEIVQPAPGDAGSASRMTPDGVLVLGAEERVVEAGLMSVPDTDALRGMVARMVREELAGGLGDRMSRNLRVLVRREVARAMSIQAMEERSGP